MIRIIFDSSIVWKLQNYTDVERTHTRNRLFFHDLISVLSILLSLYCLQTLHTVNTICNNNIRSPFIQMDTKWHKKAGRQRTMHGWHPTALRQPTCVTTICRAKSEFHHRKKIMYNDDDSQKTSGGKSTKRLHWVVECVTVCEHWNCPVFITLMRILIHFLPCHWTKVFDDYAIELHNAT